MLSSILFVFTFKAGSVSQSVAEPGMKTLEVTLIKNGETSLSRFGDDHKAQFEGRMRVLYGESCNKVSAPKRPNPCWLRLCGDSAALASLQMVRQFPALTALHKSRKSLQLVRYA
jgi:hypothetical protein